MAAVRKVGDVLIIALVLVMDLITWAGDRSLRTGSMLPYVIIPALTLAVYPILLLRGRRPVLVFGILWTFALTSLLVPQFQPFAGPLVALHAVASRLPARISAVALASMVVPFGVYSFNSAEPGSGSLTSDFLQLLILWFLLGAAVWGVGRLSYASAQRAWRLRELQAAEAAEQVRAERIRLARELHDTVSHAVITMMLQAAGARAVLDSDSERVRGSLGVIEQVGVQAMSELHRMLNLLRSVDPRPDPDLDAVQPRVDDIKELVRLAVAAGQHVQLNEEGTSGPLDPSVAVAAYRVVQESLTNSLKHAGADSAVTVRLQWTDSTLRVTVTDRDRGPRLARDRTESLSSGHGLDGLRERVTLTGGTLTSRSTPDGFEVAAQLPRPGSAPVISSDAESAA